MIAGLLRSSVRAADRTLARVALGLRRERPALITLLFHSLYRDEAEADSALMDPQQRVTVVQFAQIIERLQSAGYRFIAPREVVDELDGNSYCAMLTFDDGYFNNLRALGVLDRSNVPATIFISTNHVRLGKSFWWDVLYRERRNRGVDARAIAAEAHRLKSLRADEIEQKLLSEFGPDSFKPRGDADRPMTIEELRELARHPLVHIGNHTRDHAILTNYDSRGAGEQIAGAQQDLADWTGKTPLMIAYPNGNYSSSVIEASRSAGLRSGITVEPRKNQISETTSSACDWLMTLGRFTPWGNTDIAGQCRVFRADFSIETWVRGC